MTTVVVLARQLFVSLFSSPTAAVCRRDRRSQTHPARPATDRHGSVRGRRLDGHDPAVRSEQYPLRRAAEQELAHRRAARHSDQDQIGADVLGGGHDRLGQSS